MAWDTVDLEWSGDVATVTVDRPNALNALNVETLEALGEAVEEARAEEARVLVVRGAGDDAFIAGADIAYMKDLSTAEAQAWGELGHDVADSIERFPAPTVAVVDGYAFGGGCEMAMACDLRVGSESALIGNTEIDLGIIPGWGGTQRLPRLVGEETAKRMIYLGQRLDAETAEKEGLLGEVVPDDEIDDRVAELAAELESKPAFALEAAKDAISQGYSDIGGLDYEKRTFGSLFGTPDQREGMAAFVEDREPDFQ
ncbi:enoyl-CoA hydratase [Natronomonas moolapensis 8.8.11]|uniref:Enoyl-CoA hydratase n=1 Tax=Natronomonas moolapensis (strain DSM 18674 / CECT 7526 / JCM 14361 / 8.8.11) TaxID=268739 RepID=M1XLC3_NATM8|nr:enoyl-CoA hydratase-related protein [Natronomonas moolapensis]CCQ37460.1 enoyl-CoA hydratase [Natronomonas moolapensis 8.8.11]